MTHYLSRDPFRLPPMYDLGEAWDELLAVLPAGWQTGRPTWNERRQEWSLYAWDATERVQVGRRTREWISVHPTQVGVVRGMARCLVDLVEGRVPR